MKVVKAEEMQRIDKISIEQIGIPGEVLMGYAGKSIADFIEDNLACKKSVAVFSGTGNNGGDGFVIGYLLSNKGFNVDIYIAGSMGRVSETSRIYLNVCMNYGVEIIEVGDNAVLREVDLERYDLIIDALLGTGFRGSVRGIIKDIIEMINNCGIMILSVDIPSGLPSNGEAPDGVVIKADYTVTIGLPKVSLVIYPGRRYTGELHVSDIGFPSTITNSSELRIELIDNSFVKKRLDFARDCDAHKGMIGHLLLIGGFDEMEGAIIMAAMSAFETGIGLSTLLTTKKARSVIAGKIPELITRSLDTLGLPDLQECVKDNDENYNEEDRDLCRSIESDLESFFNEDRRYDVLLIGPGMGRSRLSSIVFNTVIDKLSSYNIKSVIIDGDGLYHLSKYLKVTKLPEDITFAITPHFYEASRLMGRSVDEIKKNRLDAAIELSRLTSAVVLLKGPSTIVTDGTETLINTSGNPSLATAGSGDVLSGIIGALLLKDISSLDAAGIGAYVHGRAADICVMENGIDLLKATDVIDHIRSVFV
ncbi:MAG: NAD(P)H-hydrate dehydratase [Spirochaetota bacterium]|nr:NAD(P)H-hydrate dehydratase [Spirochaetota bacterium]